jgi:hypothetical protein
MTQTNELHEALSLHPRDITMLQRVMSAAALEGDTSIDREVRAATVIRLFQSGIRTEAGLLAVLGYPDAESTA